MVVLTTLGTESPYQHYYRLYVNRYGRQSVCTTREMQLILAKASRVDDPRATKLWALIKHPATPEWEKTAARAALQRIDNGSDPLTDDNVLEIMRAHVGTPCRTNPPPSAGDVHTRNNLRDFTP